MNDEELITARTRVAATELLPEIRLHVAGAIVPLWEETAAAAPPYWGFAWVGGQALARYVLDHPELVVGKRVLDVGTGGGVVAIAAARSGARSVRGVDVDPRALHAARRNAELNDVAIAFERVDLLDNDVDDDVVLAGDVSYEQPLARRALLFLRRQAARSLVLVGDPGRAYFAGDELELLADYSVPTSSDLEGRDVRNAGVYRVR